MRATRRAQEVRCSFGEDSNGTIPAPAHTRTNRRDGELKEFGCLPSGQLTREDDESSSCRGEGQAGEGALGVLEDAGSWARNWLSLCFRAAKRRRDSHYCWLGSWQIPTGRTLVAALTPTPTPTLTHRPPPHHRDAGRCTPQAHSRSQPFWGLLLFAAPS